MSHDAPWTDFCAPEFPATRGSGGALALVRLLAAWMLVTILCAYLGVLLADLFRPAWSLAPVVSNRVPITVPVRREAALSVATSVSVAADVSGCEGGATGRCEGDSAR